MTKVDLITGFLGSGKTTFIKKYAKYLLESGEKIGILENDFGAVNVDMMLLQDLASERCELEMVSSGFDKDCHRRRFKTKLISMGMVGYDRVIVEPSGIYDVDEFFDVLCEAPLDRWYEIGNVITIVDATLEDDLSKEAQYLLVSQLAQAGKVILSKTETASKEQIEHTIQTLNKIMASFKCERRFESEMLGKPLGELTSKDFEEIKASGYTDYVHTKLWFDKEEIFQSVYVMDSHITEEKIKKAVKGMMQDKACGKIFRIKGFIQTEEGGWLELNATELATSIHPIAQGQDVVIVIGEDLKEEKIKHYLME